jgi:hypothetical protein
MKAIVQVRSEPVKIGRMDKADDTERVALAVERARRD